MLNNIYSIPFDGFKKKTSQVLKTVGSDYNKH